MRNVLLVTYSYPPVERSGARRPAALAKYLPRFGWTPVVLTPEIEGSPRNSNLVVETGYRDVLADWKVRLHLDRRQSMHEQLGLSLSEKPGTDKPHTLAIEVIKNLLTYPDVTKGWIPYGVKAIEEMSRKGRRCDAIISTFPPASAHLIGANAKRILGCPWIADFRDLWTQDITTMRRRDLPFLQVPLEKRTLRHADMLISVSDPWSDRLRQRYRAHEIRTIPNGFDPDEFSSRPEVTRQFTITHAGMLYQGQRDPTVLFEVLRELAREKAIDLDQVGVRFYGPVYPWLPPLTRHYGLEKVVELSGFIPRQEVLQRQMESQVLLLLSWTHPKDLGLHTGKLFEYLGAARPILAIGGNRGAMTQVLEETHAGVHLSSKNQVRDWVLQAYREYQRGGSVLYHGNTRAISQYSHLGMAEQFADALDKVTSHSGSEVSAAGVPEMAEARSPASRSSIGLDQ
ncbi:MAG: glycosyltransferase [Terriglobales bacterium]